MPGRRIEIHPAALAELKSAVEWYLARSEPAAAVDQAVALVSASPRRWQAGEHDTRRFILQRFLFAVTYREKDSGIQIWHSLMDTGALDTGRNGCSRHESRAEQSRIKVPTLTSKCTTLGWATRPAIQL
jgi:plasmid stabilization system protein ParE